MSNLASGVVLAIALAGSAAAFAGGVTQLGSPASGRAALMPAEPAPIVACTYTPSYVEIPYGGVSGPLSGSVTPNPGYGCLYLDGEVYFCDAIYGNDSPETIQWGHLNTGVGPHTLAIKASQGGPTLCSFTYVNLPPAPVPTLSEWGMILLVGVLGLAGCFGLRRRA